MDAAELVTVAAAAAGRRFDPSRARLDDGGWDFVLLLVEDDGGVRWAFRFPRRPECADALSREIRVLEVLGPSLPVAVPRYEITGTLPSGLPFGGYRAIPGQGLSADVVSEGVLDRLAEFVVTLHGLPPERFADLLTFWDRDRWRERHVDLVQRARSVVPVPPLLDAAWRRWLEDDRMWVRELSVVHGDLGGEHVLVEDGQLRGVIDWTDVRVADPALDFGDVVASLGRETADRLLARYAALLGRPLDPGLRDRAVAHWLVGPAHTIAFALDTEQWTYLDAAEDGMAVREDWLRTASA